MLRRIQQALFTLAALCSLVTAGATSAQTQTVRQLEQQFEEQLKGYQLTTPADYNAVRTLESLQKLAPSHALLGKGSARIAGRYSQLASIHIGKDNMDKAYTYLKKALSMDPKNTQALQMRAELDLKRTEHLSGLGNGIVAIAGGCFVMGSPETEAKRNQDERQHKVCVKEYAIAENEVTFAEFDRYTDATGKRRLSDKGWGRDQRPVVGVTWEQATNYAEWLSKITGQKYRLPTEAEWEFAARAGRETAFYTGDKMSKRQGNVNPDHDNYSPRGKTQNTARYKANPWGLYDMHGNVWEWTCSAYQAGYKGKNELKCSSTKPHVLRGGSWYSRPSQTRAAYRGTSKFIDANRGFRLAQDIRK